LCHPTEEAWLHGWSTLWQLGWEISLKMSPKTKTRDDSLAQRDAGHGSAPVRTTGRALASRASHSPETPAPESHPPATTAVLGLGASSFVKASGRVAF